MWILAKDWLITTFFASNSWDYLLLDNILTSNLATIPKDDLLLE